MTSHTICSLLFCIIWIFPVRIYWCLCNKYTYFCIWNLHSFSKLPLSVYSMADIEEGAESSPSWCLWSAIRSWHTIMCSVAQMCLTLWDPTDCSSPGSSAGFSRQEYWSGLPFLPTGDLPDPGIKPTSPATAGRLFIIWAMGSIYWLPRIKDECCEKTDTEQEVHSRKGLQKIQGTMRVFNRR